MPRLPKLGCLLQAISGLAEPVYGGHRVQACYHSHDHQPGQHSALLARRLAASCICSTGTELAEVAAGPAPTQHATAQRTRKPLTCCQRGATCTVAVKGRVAVEAGIEDGELGPQHEVQVAHLVVVRAARTDAMGQPGGLKVAGCSQLITCTSVRHGPTSLLVAVLTGTNSTRWCFFQLAP